MTYNFLKTRKTNKEMRYMDTKNLTYRGWSRAEGEIKRESKRKDKLRAFSLHKSESHEAQITKIEEYRLISMII